MKIETDQVIKAKTVKVKGCFGCWFRHYLNNIYDPTSKTYYARHVCKATILTKRHQTVIDHQFQDSGFPLWCPLIKTPLIVQIDTPRPKKKKKNMKLWDYLTEPDSKNI